MGLVIYQRQYQSILILALAVNLTMGPEDAALRTAVESYIVARRINIVLDCTRLGSCEEGLCRRAPNRVPGQDGGRSRKGFANHA